MGIVNLKVTLGTVNFTDWVHVTASKVATPTVTAWEDWIDVPVGNYNFIIPNLDPDNYYVRYYDAPTNGALGTLVLELIVNALTGDTIMERRFYTVGGAGLYDPANGATGVTDPYLINKTVSGAFKEGFRYYEPVTEFTFDITTGHVEVINGTSFATDEKFVVEIKYMISSTGAGVIPTGLYTGTLDVPEATKTLLSTDRNKRIRCVGTIATQVITLCPLSGLALEDGFYFDNACGGTAVQVKLSLDGGDRIRYNGFMAASDLFTEFWVSKGEHLLIRKFDSAYYEVISDYKGVEVGSRMSGGYAGMPGYMPENGSLSDGEEFCRVWWWLNNILPPTHIITDDLVVNPGFLHPPGAVGQFVKHSTLKKFRWPNTQNLSERGLKDFTTYGSDTIARPVDYPGGFQEQALMKHNHAIKTTNSGASGNDLADPIRGTTAGTVNIEGQVGVNKTIQETGGNFNQVKNIGVIYMRHI